MWGTTGAPNLFLLLFLPSPKTPYIWGAQGTPIYLFFIRNAAEGGGFPNGGRWRSEDAAPPEGEGNAADGGCFQSLVKFAKQPPSAAFLLNKKKLGRW